MRILAVFAVTAAFAAGASAAELADGDYGCTIGSAYLGDIRLEKGRFSGPAYDGAFDDSYPFTVDGKVIDWGGPLGGISQAGAIVATVLRNAGGGRIGFDITIKNANGNFQTVSCAPN